MQVEGARTFEELADALRHLVRRMIRLLREIAVKVFIVHARRFVVHAEQFIQHSHHVLTVALEVVDARHVRAGIGTRPCHVRRRRVTLTDAHLDGVARCTRMREHIGEVASAQQVEALALRSVLE